VANEMLFTIAEVVYSMKSRLLLAVLGCAAVAAPAFAWNNGHRNVTAAALQNCQSATISRLHHDGYGHVRFQSSNVLPQRNGDHVWGEARANGWYLGKTFGYSCSVDSNGYVTSAGVAMH
jgi:hypothetical protein